MNIEKQNSLIREAHENAVKHGFWAEQLSDEHFLCLVICELAGAHGVVVKEQRGLQSYVVSEDSTFTENVLAVAGMLTDGSMSVDSRLLFCMRQVERLAELEEVDLLKHIECKMRYNQLRAYKHGKAF